MWTTESLWFEIAIICCISVFVGRIVSMILLASLIIPVLLVHGYYLPKKKEINGWTGEPKSKYYEFRKWDKDIFSKKQKLSFISKYLHIP